MAADRRQFGGPDIDADDVRLAPKNVVVMFVKYLGGAGVEQSEAKLSGSGPLMVFTDGKEIKGTWSRPDKSKPARLLNSTGGAIRLTPGQTWVELPDVSYPVLRAPVAERAEAKNGQARDRLGRLRPWLQSARPELHV